MSAVRKIKRNAMNRGTAVYLGGSRVRGSAGLADVSIRQTMKTMGADMLARGIRIAEIERKIESAAGERGGKGGCKPACLDQIMTRETSNSST